MFCREAAFHLEEYETALQEFKNAIQHGAPEAKCKTWIRNCQAEIDGENHGAKLFSYYSSYRSISASLQRKLLKLCTHPLRTLEFTQFKRQGSDAFPTALKWPLPDADEQSEEEVITPLPSTILKEERTPVQPAAPTAPTTPAIVSPFFSSSNQLRSSQTVDQSPEPCSV